MKAALRAVTFMAILILAGCTSPTNTPTVSTAYQNYLYMTGTSNGLVYTYDPSTHSGSSSNLVTTSNHAAGEMKFYKGIGYVAMGTGGIYYFDPSATAPSAKLLPGSSGLSAQYFAFYSAIKAYVTTYGSGLYTFNPSSLTSNVSSSPVAGTSGLTMQEVVVGSDGFIYAADNGNGTILKINPASDSLTLTIAAGAPGTTGLVPGIYGSSTGVFVANTGGYSGSPIQGSIDFINSAGTLTTIVGPSASYLPGRLLQLSNGNLVATGYNHTFFVTGLSGSTPTPTESEISSTIGSFSLAYSNGLIYVPYNTWATNNKLYVFDSSGVQQAYSPVTVMGTSSTVTDNIANVAFYQ